MHLALSYHRCLLLYGTRVKYEKIAYDDDMSRVVFVYVNLYSPFTFLGFTITHLANHSSAV